MRLVWALGRGRPRGSAAASLLAALTLAGCGQGAARQSSPAAKPSASVSIAPTPVPSCQYVDTFKTIHDLDPADVGDCQANQTVGANGDIQQKTAKGALLLRKSDNLGSFTNGPTTWLLRDGALVSRSTELRLPWEKDYAENMADRDVRAQYADDATFKKLLPEAGAPKPRMEQSLKLQAFKIQPLTPAQAGDDDPKTKTVYFQVDTSAQDPSGRVGKGLYIVKLQPDPDPDKAAQGVLIPLGFDRTWFWNS